MKNDRNDITDEMLDAMRLERSVRPAESNAATTNRVFDEAGPTAAMRIIELARGAQSERVRLEAAKYVVDRVVGRIGEAKAADTVKDPFEALYDVVTRDATTLEAAAIERAKGKL